MKDDLKPYLERSASTDVPCLLKAKEGVKKLMNDQPSLNNIKAFKEASRALKEHLPGADGGAPGEVFKNVDAALAHLKEKGWKIGRSKMFSDAESGTLRRQTDGSILAEDLESYVVVARLKIAGEAPKANGEMAKLKIRQTKAEIREREAKASMAEMDERKKSGELISREDADNQMAMAVTVLRSSLKDFFATMLPEIVHIVGGDPKKQDVLMDFFDSNQNEFFNGFSRKSEHLVEKGDDTNDAV